MFVPWFTKPETEKKVLQIVNLSPDVSVLDKIVGDIDRMSRAINNPVKSRVVSYT